jgi:putative flippase GtrA
MLRRLVRYGAVSALTTVLSTCVLCVLVGSSLLAAAPANVVASCAGIGPSFLLNRRWVWRRAGRASLRRETVPFWAMSVAGLALSTTVAWLAADAARGLSHPVRTAVVALASLTGYGVLWLVEFFILERVVFADRRRGRPAVRSMSGSEGPSCRLPLPTTPPSA